MDKIEAADTDEASGVMLILRVIRGWYQVASESNGTRVFAGELLKDMTVDYERSVSEDRLDEVNASQWRHQIWSSFTASSYFVNESPLKEYWGVYVSRTQKCQLS